MCTKSEIFHWSKSSIRKLLTNSDLITFSLTKKTLDFMGNWKVEVSLSQKTAEVSQKVFSDHIYLFFSMLAYMFQWL